MHGLDQTNTWAMSRQCLPHCREIFLLLETVPPCHQGPWLGDIVHLGKPENCTCVCTSCMGWMMMMRRCGGRRRREERGIRRSADMIVMGSMGRRRSTPRTPSTPLSRASNAFKSPSSTPSRTQPLLLAPLLTCPLLVLLPSLRRVRPLFTKPKPPPPMRRGSPSSVGLAGKPIMVTAILTSARRCVASSTRASAA